MNPNDSHSQGLAQDAPQAQANIEIDDDAATNSAYGDDHESLSASITSSILAYRIENGRRYHAFKDGSYFFPNDEEENDRLDMQHAVFLKSCGGKLYLAPIRQDVQNAIDVGTGTGLWAVDFSDEHPSASVIGTDLSPIQPAWVPPNLSFLIDDCQDEWLFDSKFDFVHGRMLCGSLTNWPGFMEQAYKNLEPGGWIELQDINMPFKSDDGSLSKDTALWQWSDMLLRAGDILGRPVNAAEQYKKWMEEAGFVDIVEVVHKWPQNNWAKDKSMKEIGWWTMTNMLEGLHGLSMAPFTRALGMSAEAVELFLMDVRKDIKNTNVRSYWTIYFVYGRKPEDK